MEIGEKTQKNFVQIKKFLYLQFIRLIVQLNGRITERRKVMKRCIAIFSAAFLICACSKQSGDTPNSAESAAKAAPAAQSAAPKAPAAQSAAPKAPAAQPVQKKAEAEKPAAAAPAKTAAAPAAAPNAALLELEKSYKKVPGKKMGVLAVAVEEQNIILSLGSNDGFKEEQKILLYKDGKPAAEVTVVELYPEQINAGFSEGSDPKQFHSGDSLDFGILKQDSLQ